MDEEQLFQALVKADDVDVVLIEYDDMRKKRLLRTQASSQPLPSRADSLSSMAHTSPLQMYKAASSGAQQVDCRPELVARKNKAPSRRVLSSSSSSSSSSSESTVSTQPLMKGRAPQRILHTELRVASREPAGSSSVQSPAHSTKPIPPTALSIPTPSRNEPDGFEAPTPTARSMASSHAPIIPLTIVKPTGIPVIPPQEFRKMLTDGVPVSAAPSMGIQFEQRIPPKPPLRRRQRMLPPPTPEEFPISKRFPPPVEDSPLRPVHSYLDNKTTPNGIRPPSPTSQTIEIVPRPIAAPLPNRKLLSPTARDVVLGRQFPLEKKTAANFVCC